MEHEALSDEALEDEIATLSALIQAATYRLLCLVGEYDRRHGWADPLDANGFRSCAHWLCWRVGLSLGVARQYVRVARTLPELPRISSAFSRGELSYSKVRAVTRVARTDNEEMLLEWARCSTASQLEKIVRRYRRADVALENEEAMGQQAARSLVTYFDADGMLVVQGRLSPEQGAVLMKALDVSVDALSDSQNGSAEPSGGENPAAASSGDQWRADALAHVAEQSLAAVGSDSSVDRYQVVVHVDAEVLTNPESDGRCELEDGPAMAPETARRLACNASLSTMQHGPHGELTSGRKTRVVSTPLRRALRARDGTRCAFPGCTCRGRDAHHVQHWANAGPTVLENLLSLCRAHHCLVHEGGFRVEALPHGGYRFLRPDGQELLPAPVPPVLREDPEATICEQWLPAGAVFTPDTGRNTWAGESVDYDWAVELLGT